MIPDSICKLLIILFMLLALAILIIAEIRSRKVNSRHSA